MWGEGKSLFSLYIYTENFKNLLVRNHWNDVNKIGRNIPLVTLYEDCSSRHDSSCSRQGEGCVCGGGGGVGWAGGGGEGVHLYRNL